MLLSEIENKIKEVWKGTPAVIEVKELKSCLDVPKWEDCQRDHLYVGIIRKNHGDTVVVVKHKFECIADLTCSIEKVSEKTLNSLPIFPEYSNMVCSKCGKFSTRIDIGGICAECSKEKDKCF